MTGRTQMYIKYKFYFSSYSTENDKIHMETPNKKNLIDKNKK